jgi:hypothetical protein
VAVCIIVRVKTSDGAQVLYDQGMSQPAVRSIAPVIAVTALAAITFGCGYRESESRLGKNLEVRLLALDGGQLHPGSNLSSNQPPAGADVFSAADAKRVSESGEALTGWRWIPVISSLTQNEHDVLQTLAVHRFYNNRLYGLVGDQPSTSLTHRGDLPTWGVTSAKVTREQNESYRNVTLTAKLNDAGGKLLTEFSGRFIGHYLAVVIGDQIVMAPKVQTAVGQTFLIVFPPDQMEQASDLRLSLLSEAR